MMMSDAVSLSSMPEDSSDVEEQLNIRIKNEWKPAKFISYETMGLTKTKLNDNMRPCGFRSDGTARVIKSTCMVARMKRSNLLDQTHPKLAVCITMYNENETEFKDTISGVL